MTKQLIPRSPDHANQEELRVSRRRNIGKFKFAWGRFTGWSEFAVTLPPTERARRDLLADRSRLQCINSNDTPASDAEVMATLHEYDTSRFEVLRTPGEWEQYIHYNPFGKFKERAEQLYRQASGRHNSPTEPQANGQINHQWHAFLSHSSKDNPRARMIRDYLQAKGLTSWLDEDEIHPGHSVIEKIEQGLIGSGCILVLLSKAFAESSWCRTEYQPYMNKEVSAGRKGRVIPVEVEELESDQVPMILRDIHRARLVDSNGSAREQDWNKLIAAIRAANA